MQTRVVELGARAYPIRIGADLLRAPAAFPEASNRKLVLQRAKDKTIAATLGLNAAGSADTAPGTPPPPSPT